MHDQIDKEHTHIHTFYSTEYNIYDIVVVYILFYLLHHFSVASRVDYDATHTVFFLFALLFCFSLWLFHSIVFFYRVSRDFVALSLPSFVEEKKKNVHDFDLFFYFRISHTLPFSFNFLLPLVSFTFVPRSLFSLFLCHHTLEKILIASRI